MVVSANLLARNYSLFDQTMGIIFLLNSHTPLTATTLQKNAKKNFNNDYYAMRNCVGCILHTDAEIRQGPS